MDKTLVRIHCDENWSIFKLNSVSQGQSIGRIKKSDRSVQYFKQQLIYRGQVFVSQSILASWKSNKKRIMGKSNIINEVYVHHQLPVQNYAEPLEQRSRVFDLAHPNLVAEYFFNYSRDRLRLNSCHLHKLIPAPTLNKQRRMLESAGQVHTYTIPRIL